MAKVLNSKILCCCRYVRNTIKGEWEHPCCKDDVEVVFLLSLAKQENNELSCYAKKMKKQHVFFAPHVFLGCSKCCTKAWQLLDNLSNNRFKKYWLGDPFSLSHGLPLTFILDKEVIAIKASCLINNRCFSNNAFKRLLKQPWGKLMIIDHSCLIHYLLSCVGLVLNRYVRICLYLLPIWFQ